MHLVYCQVTRVEQRLEEVELVSPAGIDHGHGGQYEVDLLLDLGMKLLSDGFETVAENFLKFHMSARAGYYLYL